MPTNTISSLRRLYEWVLTNTLPAAPTSLSKNVSPANMLDTFVERMELAMSHEAMKGHGAIYVTTPQPTTITGAGTYYKAAGITAIADQDLAHHFDMPANGRLRWIGEDDVILHIAGNLSVTSAANNHVIRAAIFKNGSLVSHSEVPRKIATGADVGAMPIHASFAVSKNDYIELWLQSETASATTITEQAMYLYAMAMPKTVV